MGPGFRFGQSATDRGLHELGVRGDLELGEEPVLVGLDGGGGDPQIPGDFGEASALQDTRQDAFLLRREVGRLPGVGGGAFGEGGLSLQDRGDGGEDPFRRRRFGR